MEWALKDCFQYKSGRFLGLESPDSGTKMCWSYRNNSMLERIIAVDDLFLSKLFRRQSGPYCPNKWMLGPIAVDQGLGYSSTVVKSVQSGQKIHYGALCCERRRGTQGV